VLRRRPLCTSVNSITINDSNPGDQIRPGTEATQSRVFVAAVGNI